MDPPSPPDFPRRSSARPILQSRFSLEDKLLGLSLSPSSAQSLSSDTTDANGLDELDEQEIWEMEEGSSVDPRKGQPSLPPRIGSRGRTASGRSATPERRSHLKDGISLWTSSAAKGLSSISGLHPQNIVVRSPTGRILGSEATSRRIPAASRMIPGLVPQEIGPRKEETLEDGSARMMPQSAPVNIPDWSKLERKESRQRGVRIGGAEIGRDEEDEERLPPHEFLAREYARSQASFSVFEGTGRTLKGRDMTRVRNAVLTRTGFLE